MGARLKAVAGSLLWRARGGVTLPEMPTAETTPLTLTSGCLHPRGCWSYCTSGYRYCLCCNQVRVRC